MTNLFSVQDYIDNQLKPYDDEDHQKIKMRNRYAFITPNAQNFSNFEKTLEVIEFTLRQIDMYF